MDIESIAPRQYNMFARGWQRARAPIQPNLRQQGVGVKRPHAEQTGK